MQSVRRGLERMEWGTSGADFRSGLDVRRLQLIILEVYVRLICGK